MGKLGGHRSRSTRPVSTVSVVRGDVDGMIEVVVDSLRYTYAEEDLAGWVLRIAVSLNLDKLDTILEEMRKI